MTEFVQTLYLKRKIYYLCKLYVCVDYWNSQYLSPSGASGIINIPQVPVIYFPEIDISTSIKLQYIVQFLALQAVLEYYVMYKHQYPYCASKLGFDSRDVGGGKTQFYMGCGNQCKNLSVCVHGIYFLHSQIVSSASWGTWDYYCSRKFFESSYLLLLKPYMLKPW